MSDKNERETWAKKHSLRSILVMYVEYVLKILRNFHLFSRIINEFFMEIMTVNVWWCFVQYYFLKKKDTIETSFGDSKLHSNSLIESFVCIVFSCQNFLSWIPRISHRKFICWTLFFWLKKVFIFKLEFISIELFWQRVQRSVCMEFYSARYHQNDV